MRRRQDGDVRGTSKPFLGDAAARPTGKAAQLRGRQGRQDDKATQSKGSQGWQENKTMQLRHRQGGNARRSIKSDPCSRRRTKRGEVMAGREAT